MAGYQSIKTAVVVPVYDEPDTWREIALELTLLFDLVAVVDDGSSIPLECPRQERLVLLRHPVNMGKGAALRSGFRYCLEQDAQLIGTIDSDGEHDFRNFFSVLGQYDGEDMINLSRAPFFRLYGFWRKSRNVLISRFISFRMGITVEDTQSGMRLFSAKAVESCLEIKLPSGYAIETIMLETIVAQKMQLIERPMQHAGHIRGGKKYRDLKVLWVDLATFSSRFAQGIGTYKSRKNRFSTPDIEVNSKGTCATKGAAES